MQLIGGMTIKQLLDKSRSMGELDSASYPRWVEQVMNSERDELHQWHVLELYSGCVELPMSAQKEMHAIEKSKDYEALTNWLLNLEYPILQDAAAFWFKQIMTCIELLPFVAKTAYDEKKKQFLTWTLVHVWQVSSRNMVMGHEDQPGWIDENIGSYINNVDKIIAVMGRGSYERFLFSFECYWANPHIETFYQKICDHLAGTFNLQLFDKDFCNMNYLYHVARRCGTQFWGNKAMAQQLIKNMKEAAGHLSNSDPSTWKALDEMIYDAIVPIYIRAYDEPTKAIEEDIADVQVKREGWNLTKELGKLAEQETREAVWLGLLVCVASETANEALFQKIADVIFKQYHASDKKDEYGVFGLNGLITTVYNRIVERHQGWIGHIDRQILREFNDFVEVAVLLSSHCNYDEDVKNMLHERWDMEKDVIAIKMKGAQWKVDCYRKIEHWVKYKV